MSLWIRVQDKEQLLQVERLFLRDKMICTNIREVLGWTPLGEYNTKERALEVLDEIQKVMQAKYALNFDEKKESFRKFSPTQCQKLIENMAVYEMPKN